MPTIEIITRWKNGKIKERFNVDPVTKKKEGLYSRFFRNDIKNVECTYKDGLIEGRFLKWFMDGTKGKEYIYKDGLVIKIIVQNDIQIT